MERAEVLKLYTIGGLSVGALTLSGMVFTSTVPVDDRNSQGTQYLLVGVLLGVIFGFFGGFEDLRHRTKGLGSTLRRSGTAVREPSHSTRTRLFGHMNLDADNAANHIERAGRSPAPSVAAGAPGTGSPPGATSSGLDLPPSVWAGGLTVRPTTTLEVTEAVTRHESMILDRLIADGRLSAAGPISDDDVRVMVATSIVSAELSERLLGLIDPTLADGACRGPARSP